MKKLIGLLTIAVLFAGISIAQAIDFGLATTYKLLDDSRIRGNSTQFRFASEIADGTKAGYLTEQENLNVTNETNSANVTRLISSLNALTLEKEVATILDLIGIVGLEIGSLSITQIGGFALPAAITQNVPVMGINAKVKYGKVGKLSSNICLDLNYRIADITDVANPFGAGTRAITSLSGLAVGLEFVLGF